MRILWLAVLLVGSVAHADDKRPLGVLSVVPSDMALTRSAETITATIRKQASARSSEYRVKGTTKEIDAAMIAAECNTMQPACAAKVGGALGVELTIAGEVTRRGEHQRLLLALVDVRTKQRIRSVQQTTTSNGDAAKLARTAYTRLIGGDLGELAVIANAQRGEVLIDGQVVAGLFEGRTTVTSLLKGSHVLSIRAAGFKPFDVDIVIEAVTKQMVLLERE